MDVRLPNGQIISNVPDGVSKREIAEKAISYGLATPEDFGDFLTQAQLPEDETTFLGAGLEFGKRAIGGIGTGLSSVVTGLGQLVPGLDDDKLIAADTAVREKVAETLGYDPAYDESYAAQLGTVVGEVVPTLIPYLGRAGRALSLGRNVAAGSMMAGQALTEGGYDRQAFEQETGEDISATEEVLAKGRDVLLGQLERFGIPQRILKGLPKGFFATKEGNNIAKRIESLVISGAAEGAQEVGQGIVRDITDLAIYNPDQEIGESALDDFTLGAGAGAFFDLVLGFAGGKRGLSSTRPREDIRELTDEEKEQERLAREAYEAETLDKDASSLSFYDQGFAGPPDVVGYVDPFGKDISERKDNKDISNTIIKRQGVDLPIGQVFDLEITDDGYRVALDGEQFGPTFKDSNDAAEVATNLTNYSIGLRKSGEIDYLAGTSNKQYSDAQLRDLQVFGRALPDLESRRYTRGEVDLAVETPQSRQETSNLTVDELLDQGIPKARWSASQKIDYKRIQSGAPVTNTYTLDEIKSVNKGSLGKLGEVMAGRTTATTVVPVKMPEGYKLRTNNGVVLDTPAMPDFGTATRAAREANEKSLLGNTIPSTDVLSLEGEAEAKVSEALANKNIDVRLDSKEMSGLIKKLIGKTPSKKNPVRSLKPEETQLLLHEITRLPRLDVPTALPNLAQPVPNQELVRRTRNAVSTGRGTPSITEMDFVTGQPTSQAEARRVRREGQRTAQRAEQEQLAAQAAVDPYRAGQGNVPANQQVQLYDPDNSGAGQILRDLAAKFGLGDKINTRMVDQVGQAVVDRDGNVRIIPTKSAADAQGSYQSVAKLIQVALDDIRVRVGKGATYEEAIADVFNHEVVHALRALDLFTPQEWNLLEKLSRTYKLPGTNTSYTQWAQQNYSDMSPVVRQEEAIAQMIRHALTTGVNMDGGVQKPGGKVRQLLNKIIEFFKSIVTSGKNADVQSFAEIVEEIRTGKIGRRDAEIRTKFRQEKKAGVVPERLIDEEFFQTQRPSMAGDTPEQVVNNVNSQIPNGERLQDAAGISDDMLFSRIERAKEQGFDTGTVYYHGNIGRPDGSGKKTFRGRVGNGAIAGHFTDKANFAAGFARGLGETNPVIYPVFLRKGRGDNEIGGLFDVRKSDQDGALQVLIDTIETPLDSMPRLKEGLTNYYTQALLEDKRMGFGGKSEEIIELYRTAPETLEVSGRMVSKEEIAPDVGEALAREYHRVQAANLDQLISDIEDESIDFGLLERYAPYIKEAGFTGYYDIEELSLPYTGIAMFDNADIKGVYAEFNPDNVPEGMDYADDIMFSRKAGRPNTDLRPEVARAYKALVEGRITRGEYQDIVAETVRPYESVPVPATYDEMYNALTRDKREKINVPIEDGSSVGLRLDIPAYTQHGVWVPTIHGRGGKASHRATAAIANADFTRTSEKAAQRIMEAEVEGTEGYAEVKRLKEDLAAGRIDKKRYDARMGQFSKSPFAQIKGEFINRSDAENYALAREAINSPEWTQVGFDPRRRSVFYDRVDGNPVATADEVVQVGPLVLAKNARFRDDDVMYSRGSGAPITKAIQTAKEKYSGVRIATEEEFFGKFWPELIRSVGGTVSPDKLRVAAKRAMRDIKGWVEENPKYNDYYTNDMNATRQALEQEYGPITDDQFMVYRFIAGVTSPGTKLSANIRDAVQGFDVFMRDGNFDSFVMGVSKEGNPVIESAPFRLSGLTSPTKARSLKAFDSVVRDQGGVRQAIDYLLEPVPMRELESWKKSLGYAGVPNKGQIKGLVKDATGQDDLIPRIFYLGPKVGAYTLNTMGNGKYQTVDVWEARFIRSYFDNMFSVNTGITATADEGSLFRDFSKVFAEEFEKSVGYKPDPSTLQAMRWFYMINAAKQAGYRGASTNETISELTEQKLRQTRRTRYGGRGQGASAVQADDAVFSRRFPAIRTAPDAGVAERIRQREGRYRSRNETPLEGSPTGRAIDGKGPDAGLNAVAEEYAEQKGIPLTRQSRYAEVDEDRATRIANAYESMAHDPTNPRVIAAYNNLIAQTIEQYNALIDGGYTFSFFDIDTDPYQGNPFSAMRDLRNNKHMAVFGTYAGYGTDGITESARNGNPLLVDVGIQWPDQNGEMQDVTANDLFRAVHDAFGHGLEGAGFRARGEENAWQAHRKLFTGPAVAALTTETRGQNSWLNYGPSGESNRTATLEDTVFAEQKAGLMPSWTWNEGVVDGDTREIPEFSVERNEDVVRSRVDQRDIDAVVAENKAAASDPREKGIPFYSDRAEPRAQYIARNPDKAMEPSDDAMYSLRQPNLSDRGQRAIDSVLEERNPVSLMDTYLAATGESKLSYKLTKFKQMAVNRYARLEKLNRDPRLRGHLADTGSIQAALFADRSMGIVGAALKYGVPVYRDGGFRVERFSHNGENYKGLVGINGLLNSKQHGDLTKLAQAYAMAKRGERLNSEGKPTPITDQARQDIYAEVERFTDAENNNPIKKWLGAYQAYNEKVINFMQATGVLDAARADQWRRQSDYVPFYRTDNNGEMTGPGKNIFGGMTNAVSMVAYKGSEKKINSNLIESTALNLSMAVQMGMQNVAQQRIARDMITLGLARQVGQYDQVDSGITFRVNGKRARVEIFDPLVYESMKGLGSDQAVALVQATLGKPAGFLREMVTRTPDFMLANLMRDSFSAWVTSGSKVKPIIGTAKGLASDVEQLEMLGVVGGYDFSNDPDNIAEFYAKENAKRGIGKSGGVNPLLGFKMLWDFAGKATTKSDAATRQAVFDDVLARTGNVTEAAFQALEVINFSRRGSNVIVRMLTASIPFLNARFQGLDVLARSALGHYSADKSKLGARATASFIVRGSMLAGITAMYYAMFSDDDQYKEQSEEVRDNNWLIPTPWGAPIRIPIPFEVGLIFKTLPETMMALQTGQKSAKEARETIQTGIVSTLEINPLGIQAFAPLVEAALNKNFYTGGEIVPYYMDKMEEPGLQSKDTTGALFKMVGETFNISPIKLEHIARGYTGTIGAYILDGVDVAVRPVAQELGVEMPDLPSRRFFEMPVLKRFFASNEGSGLKQDAYDLYADVSTAVKSMKKLAESGRTEELNSYIQSRANLLSIKSNVYSVKRYLDSARKQREQIFRSDLDPETKRFQLDQIDAQVNEMLKVIPILKKAADQPAFQSTF